MKLTKRQQAVLCAVLVDLEYWTQQEVSGYGYVREKRLIAAAKDGYVRCDPARWLGEGTLDVSMRVMVSRCYRQLEEKGLVERLDWRGGGHTTHLKLTPAGVALAKQVLAETEPAAT